MPDVLVSVMQTIVQREQSDLTDNATYCCADCCRKGV